jgi:F0F1-type ATP synthase epsilon subunit
VQDKSEASMMVEGGVVEVLNNTITVLAEKVIQE